ncbi:MAG: hypothetical protein DCC55_07780 [Chloroflexi bacterium]|nr:MAG: hypothetical protein DCC55_07780 [Chloroflexota bacterium]
MKGEYPVKRSAIGLCAHKLLTGLVALSLLLTSTGVSQAQPPGNGDARIYLPLIQEGVQPQTTTIDANTADTVVASAEPGLPASATFRAAPGQALRARHDESTLEIGSAAVAAEIAISITPLNSQHLPPLDQGMTNVTRGPRRGYRFLPHMRFQENVVVSLPYDEKLIPPGMTANDIHTFYYDEVTASWIMLERVAVDAEAKVINSLTDHFTDMINATVAAPEQPQPLSYNPTSMKSVKAADPSTGITLIAPPQANSTGDATLTYPLEVPPGRNGLTPHLAINYNSAAVNGWLGVGWNLASSAITIDTRWGVPRYDEDNETETYTLDGAQLTPVAHRAQLEPRTAEKTFHTRIEGAFRRIVRHGDHPSNYWWEVTDKTGVRYFYGGDPSTGALAPDAILTDASGNVFRWVLREVRDLNGNTIRYAYAHVVDYGQPGGTVEGSQLYLESINYTGSNGAAGPYTITFERTSELGQPRRPDVIIDGRGGFKMVTADLLKRIDVTFNGALVRRYELEYQEGAFRKSLLRSISQFGEDGSLFYTHEFTYYDDIRDGSGAYVGFAEPDGWTTQPDGVTAGLLGFGQASLLGGTINDSVGGHLYLGFNPGAPTKPFSAGGKIGHNRSTSEGVLTLTDVNGDNLPDKVFVQNERIYVRLNESTPGSAPRFSETSHEIASLRDFMSPPQFLKEEAQTTSFGPEAYPGVNIFTNFANTFTTRSIYLSDVNGDGLVDLVNNGQVLFNYLAANGLPTFTPDSNQTGVPVGPGTVDATDLIEDYEELYQQAIDTFPLHDTLRRWVAPFDGNIRISGDVTLIGDTSPARAQYETADGVRVAIQRNGSELWVDTIPATAEDTPVTPTNVDVISVQAGDRIYFRVQSVFDGAFDQVQWDPKIEYLDASAPLDANGLNPYVYQASDDFVMAGRRDIFVQMPITGTVRVTGDLQKLGATTDDVTLLVLKNDVPVVEQTLSWDQTGTIPLDAELPVNQMDILKLRVKVDSPIDLRQIAWVPQITYVSAADPNQVVVDDQGNPIFVIDPPYDIDMYPVNDLTMPQQPWIATETGEATVTTQVTAPSLDTSGTVVFTVKRPSALVAKGTVTINNGVVQNTQLTIDVTAGEPLYFDYSVYDPELRSKLGNADQVRVEFGAQTGTPTVVQAPSVLHSSSAPGLFGQPYRGWAYAGYNGNRDRAEQPIVEADLQQQFNEDSTYDPEQAKAYLFYPFPAENMWRGPDDLGYIQGGVVSSSRLGLDYISVPGEDGFGGARAVKLLSRTSQTAVGGGVLFLSGSVSGEGPLDGGSHSEIDFQDMNGDKYPDIVSKGHIQYTTADGGLEPAKRAVPGMVQPPGSDAFPLISDNEAFNVGIGGSPATFVANGAGEVDSSAVSGPAQNGTGTQMVQLGLSGSLGGGNSRVLANLVDMNGDGLPDRVRQVGNELWVALNLGYSFADEEKWGAGTINVGESDNVSIGASLGFNGGIYDFAGGLSLNKSISYVRRSLLDINGDGLTDQVRQDGNRLLVALNLGGEFTPEFEWRGALSDGFIVNANTGLGAGVYFTIGIGPLCLFACYVIVNPGADASQNMARQEVNLRDVDGDGFVDHVASSVDNVMEVARNRTGRTNLLKSVARPLGASFELSYARDGNTPDLPQSRWVLSKVTVNDGHPGDGVDTLVTTFRYEDGVYSRLEREFFGYGRVVTENRDASNGEALYRAVVQEFRTDSYYTQRLPAREVIQDAAGNIFTEKEYTYLLRDVASGAEPANAQSTTATIFPQAVRVDNRYYEGQATPGKSTFVTNQYDALGNLVQYFDAGDTGVDDDFLSVMAYSADVPACMANHIVATPLALTITGNGSVMRQRQAQIDCTTGKVTQVRQYLENGDVAVTDVSYFANGNLRQITRPANHNGERYQTSYEYDAATQTHVTQITDSFGYVSSATYNLKYGVAASTTDINGQQTTYTFDVFGRMTSVTGPFEQGGSTPTIRFSYHPHAPTPWALTQHLDTYRNPADPIESVLFVDGLGRPLQTKKDITLHTGPDSAPQSVMAVSGRIVFDFLGRIVAQSYPVTETVGSPGVFNNTVDSVAPTRMAYDVMDRNTRITNPDNTFQTVTYGFEANRNGVLHHVRTQTDANGVVKKLYQNVRESLTDLQEFNTVNDSPQTIWTSYEYDPLSQLLSIRDDQDNVTRFVYDNFGRRTAGSK